MLPLGRQGAVPGDHGPAVRQHLHLAFAGVDHGFDGEAHARLQHDAVAGVAVVQDLGILVELAADAVAAVLPHHRVVLRLHVALDGVADIAQMGAGAHLTDAEPQRFQGDAHQPFRQYRGRADEEHLAGVAVEAVLDHGDVDVDDVPLLQPLVPGDAVTHLVIDRGADGLGETAVVERCRNRLLLVDDVVVADAVDLIGGDPRLHVRCDHLEHLGRQPAGHTHLIDLFRCLDGDAHGGIRVSWRTGAGAVGVSRSGRLWEQARYGIKRALESQTIQQRAFRGPDGRALRGLSSYSAHAPARLPGCPPRRVGSRGAWRPNP